MNDENAVETQQNGATETFRAEPSRGGVDVEGALRRSEMLLKAFEESGHDLCSLTAPDFDDGAWPRLEKRAGRREAWNPRVFSGEAEMCRKFHSVESESIRAEAHGQILCYERRSKTSHTIATALVEAYEAAEDSDEGLDCQAFKNKLGELLSVARALSTEHELILSLADDALIGDAEERERLAEETAQSADESGEAGAAGGDEKGAEGAGGGDPAREEGLL